MDVKHRIILTDSGVDFYTDGTVEDAVMTIIEELERSDLSVTELLDNIEIQGYNVIEVIKIYATTVKKVLNLDVILKDADSEEIYILED